MAFDGIAVHAVTNELNNALCGGRISKIAQPEKDELHLSIKNEGNNYLLMISANASVPLICLTDEKKESPLTAPLFCMVLRKHIGGGMIKSITQPGLERCVDITVEHLDEMGDTKEKILSVELMGKHSNIIFRDGDKIIESLKHIPLSISSVREVLPGREYFIPSSDDKTDIILSDADESAIRKKLTDMQSETSDKTKDVIIRSFTGFSPVIANEVIERAHIDHDKTIKDLNENDISNIVGEIINIKNVLEKNDFSPCIYYDDKNVPIDFSMFDLNMYSDLRRVNVDSISKLLISFYNEKKNISLMRSKSSDLTHIVKTLISRNAKKLDLQLKQLKDTDKRDKYQLYGELLNIYGYDAKPGDKEIKVIDYHTEKEITIPLDDTINAQQNAKKYYDKYAKLKRTYEALTTLTKETEGELNYLKGVLRSIELAENDADLNEIREELSASGLIKKKAGGKGKNRKVKNEPLKFLSCDGDLIYVGKNNLQNEEITFKIADNRDWWFHAKGLPGSHVLLKCAGKEPSDKAFEEAARLAAHFSAAGDNDKVEIDYVKKKEVKKPAGGRLGYVIYYTNYSMVIDTDISDISRA